MVSRCLPRRPYSRHHIVILLPRGRPRKNSLDPASPHPLPSSSSGRRHRKSRNYNVNYVDVPSDNEYPDKVAGSRGSNNACIEDEDDGESISEESNNAHSDGSLVKANGISSIVNQHQEKVGEVPGGGDFSVARILGQGNSMNESVAADAAAPAAANSFIDVDEDYDG